jgi:hypothetical protein
VGRGDDIENAVDRGRLLLADDRLEGVRGGGGNRVELPLLRRKGVLRGSDLEINEADDPIRRVVCFLIPDCEVARINEGADTTGEGDNRSTDRIC